jgi:hypothetical protein
MISILEYIVKLDILLFFVAWAAVICLPLYLLN